MLLEEYDVVILGGGIKECLLAALLTKMGGKRVLLADRNPRLGGSTPTLHLQQLCEQTGTFHLDISEYGNNVEWRFDMAPKLFLANGPLSSILEESGLVQYIKGTSVGNMISWEGKLHEAPLSDNQIKYCSLISQDERLGYKNILKTAFKDQKPGYMKMIKKIKTKVNLASKDSNDPTPTLTISELFSQNSLKPAAQYLLGRCIALHPTNSYLSQPASQTLERIRTYSVSYQDSGTQSPLVYPQRGPSSLMIGSHVLVGSHGGVVMLEQDIGGIGLDARGKVEGVVFEDRTIKCDVVVGSPDILPDRCTREGQIARAVCVLRRDECCVSDATLITVPASQGDVYVVVLTENQGVCPAGWCIAVVSTWVATPDENTNSSLLIDHHMDTTGTEISHLENILKPGLDVLGSISLKFFSMSDHWVPAQDSTPDDNVFLTSTLDASPNSMSLANELYGLYEKIMSLWTSEEQVSVSSKSSVKRSSSFSFRPGKSVKRSSSFSARQLTRSGSSASSSKPNSLLRD